MSTTAPAAGDTGGPQQAPRGARPSGPWLLGLDLGGGGVRALLASADGSARHGAHVSLRARPTPGCGGLGFDLDPPALLRALGEAVRGCLGRAGAKPEEVVGVACTSMRMSTVVRGHGDEILLATPNRDARAVAAGLGLAAQRGSAIHARSGHWPYPIFSAARLLWLRESQPSVFARATAVLSASEWLAEWLCGERAADPTQAGETLLFDLATRSWAWDEIELHELDRGLFPRVAEPGSALGTIRPEAASALGLGRATVVAVGAADTQSALLGCGALDPGAAVAVAGTTTPVQLVLDAPTVDPEARVWTGQHVLSDRWVLESNAGPMGEALDWWAALLHPDDRAPIRRVFAEAAACEDSAGMVSTLGAEIMHARERGLPFGSLGLTHMTTRAGAPSRAALSRAVVEGAACAVRGNLDQLARIGGRALRTRHLTGGLSRSPGFAQRIAEVGGAPLHVAACAEASALGAAACAGVAAGVFRDLRSAARALVAEPRIVAPTDEAFAGGEAVFARWSQQHNARLAADREAAALTTGTVLGRVDADSKGSRLPHRLRILATADLDAEALTALRELGDVEYASYRDVGRMLKGEALVEALQGFDTFLTEIDVLDAGAIAALPELRVVFTCRGDAVNVDARACALHGVPVLNAPGRNADAVADLAVAFLLMLARRLPEATPFLRAHPHDGGDLATMGRAYGSLRGHELWGRSVGLVGLGAVGRAVARRLAGFGAEILVADPFVVDEDAALVDAASVGLDELLERCDLVSLHAAVTDATRGLLDAAALARMKPGAALVNTARAALIDERALEAALREGTLSGAALDVFSVEPPGSDHPLLALPNVIATPHIAGNTFEVAAHQGRIAAAELGRLLRGERPRSVVDPSALDHFDLEGPRRVPTAAELASLAGEPGPAVSDLQRDQSKPPAKSR